MDRKKYTLIATAVFLAGLFAWFTILPDGAVIFSEEGCIDCHSFKGRGGSTCPDLTAVTGRRSDSWIRRQINDPRSHNPNSMMPSFSHLSYREISALIQFFKS
ncbi:MAG: cbb3-type cytochrome c oxidase subunit II [Nitrospiraceae bacterium]|nr:cbb3-type cytochrome c oxidase subunit II [Nitrospiraceae bacterium]